MAFDGKGEEAVSTFLFDKYILFIGMQHREGCLGDGV